MSRVLDNHEIKLEHFLTLELDEDYVLLLKVISTPYPLEMENKSTLYRETSVIDSTRSTIITNLPTLIESQFFKF